MTDPNLYPHQNSPISEARGYSTYNRQVTPGIRRAAFLFDVALFVFVGALALSSFHLSPRIVFPLLGFSLVASIVLAASRQTLRAFLFRFFSSVFPIGLPSQAFLSPGERLWSLRTTDRLHLIQWDRLKISTLLSALSVSLIAFSLCGFLVYSSLFNYPIWPSTAVELPASEAQNENSAIPLFYSLGSWPKTFQEKPVFYDVLYEKGPPNRFIGHITARLGLSRSKLTIEGPKTPEGLGGRNDIRRCFVESSFSSSFWGCLAIKDRLLSRHIEEMKKVFGLWPAKWNVRWFSVKAGAEGVWLTAFGENFTQDRFILINSNGSQQALILTRPIPAQTETDSSAHSVSSEELEYSKVMSTVLDLMGSLKTLGFLNQGREWINQKLQQIHLDQLQAIQDPTEKIKLLAEIQLFLLSSISVDPASFESYFHLAGTSYLLFQMAPKDSPTRAVALQNFETSRKYARDLLSSDLAQQNFGPNVQEQMHQIEQLAKEIRSL
ncbi:MAG: hypothetical protein HYX41_02425 [Bdellovibrio sp.]|nr:hypothetical protein [Bdellovibrio sp.]